MQIHPAAIPVVVYVMLGCACIGYLSMLVACLYFHLDSKAAWTILGVHTVGVFGLLLRYLGGSMKVTATSAGTG
jgi:hypothetical protein